ncbi:MAG: hypothetical protein IKP71_01450, partial [Candidatus Riflebacteria bacterium]|nr:hypothetical protein [Candidatus Riflebacteria bacterium]
HHLRGGASCRSAPKAKLLGEVVPKEPKGVLKTKQPAIWFIEYAKSGFRLRIKKYFKFFKNSP